MKKIKVIALGVILTLTGAVYAAQTASSTSTPEATTTMSCCTMEACCAGGSCQMQGSCCDSCK